MLQYVSLASFAFVLTLAVAGCGNKEPSKEPPAAKKSDVGTAVAADGSATKPGGKADVPADPTADAKALLASWVAAQNSGDLAAYSALYDAKFVGVKRTTDGGEKKLDLATWTADRKKMFGKKQYADHGEKLLSLRRDPTPPRLRSRQLPAPVSGSG